MQNNKNRKKKLIQPHRFQVQVETREDKVHVLKRQQIHQSKIETLSQ